MVKLSVLAPLVAENTVVPTALFVLKLVRVAEAPLNVAIEPEPPKKTLVLGLKVMDAKRVGVAVYVYVSAPAIDPEPLMEEAKDDVQLRVAANSAAAGRMERKRMKTPGEKEITITLQFALCFMGDTAGDFSTPLVDAHFVSLQHKFTAPFFVYRRVTISLHAGRNEN
jgi:hypothetical protein